MDDMQLCIGLDETKIMSVKFLGASNFCTIQTYQGVFLWEFVSEWEPSDCVLSRFV